MGTMSNVTRRSVSVAVVATSLIAVPQLWSSSASAMERLAPEATTCFDGELPSGEFIPQGATVTATVTGIQPDATGFISLHARDQAFDETSSLNIEPGLNLANTTTYVAGPDGEICITASVGTNAAVDVVAFETSGLELVDERRFDSRSGERLAPEETRCLDGSFASGAMIPEGATVTATVTGIRPDDRGFISLHRRDQPFDQTSSLNINAGLNLANTTSYVAGPDGEICITASVATHATLDVIGYRMASAAVEVDERVYDTRRDGQRLGSLIFPTSRQCFDAERTGVALPPNAAVTATVTGIRPLGIGFVSIMRLEDPLDATSALNIKDELNLANTTTFVTDDDGEFCLYSSSNTDATLDIISYEAESDLQFVNQRIFDTRRAPLTVPDEGPVEPVFVSGDASFIGRVTVDCSYGTLRSGGDTFPTTRFTVEVTDIPRDQPVGDDGVFNEYVYEIDLYAPPLYRRGQGSSQVDADSISASGFVIGTYRYMRGTVTINARSGSGNLAVDIFGGGIDGGATFDVPGVACHEFRR